MFPRGDGPAAVARCPAVADVMGGIGEDGGALVLTATLAKSILVACWPTRSPGLQLRWLTEEGQGPVRDGFLPVDAVFGNGCDATSLLARCKETACDWAAASVLTLQQAVATERIPRPIGGLAMLLQTDFPTDADFARPWVQAAATIDAACKALGGLTDRLRQSQICAAAVEHITGLYAMRFPMTALCGPTKGALLQLRFHPQVLCQPMELPPDVVIMAVRTRLTRPVTRQRLIETRTCAEMGRRMISELQRSEGMRVDEASIRLAAITPAEYVDRYRDRLPQKITGGAFTVRFGTLRGLNGKPDQREVYKVRSRAEHYIYENRRVHEFVTDLVRARRSHPVEALSHAGELMYASHWSHSQRCGIGGVEPDQIVTCIRKRGPQNGLYGAKVTGGGEGGELVVLMRDDARSHQALSEAIAAAQAAGHRPITTFNSSTGGAEDFRLSSVEGLVGVAG